MTELPERKDFGDYGQWPGRAVLDTSGRRLGDVREIYLDDATDRPEWVLVELGDRGRRFVPLAGATVDGEAIRVTQESGRVEAAPSLEAHKQLTQAEERRLYSHYGLRTSEQESDSLLPAVPVAEPPAEPVAEPPAEPVAQPPAEPVAQPPAEPVAQPTAEPVAEPTAEPVAEPTAEPVAEPAEPVAELPAEGETSEPEDRGPMVPPRPEPVAPAPLEPASPGGPLAALRGRPAVVGGIAASLAAIVFIVLRRRG